MTQRDQIQLDILAYLEGALEPDDAQRVREAIAAGGAWRDEYAWLKAMEDELEAAGDAIVRDAPPVDLREQVLLAVADLEETHAAETGEPASALPAGAPPRPTSRVRWTQWAAGIAAAAAIALVAWSLFAPPSEPLPGEQPVALDTPGPTPAPEPAPPVEPPAAAPADPAMAETLRDVLADLDTTPPPDQAPRMARTEGPALAEVAPDDVAALRRDASVDPQARQRLQELATLDPEQAAAIAEEPDAPTAAIIAAGRALEGAEAEQMLLHVVGDTEDPRYVQTLVARKVADRAFPAEAATAPDAGLTDAAYAELLRALDELQASDPGNSHYTFMEAWARARRGDVAGTLDALDALREGEYRSDALAAAQVTAAGLEAAGADPEVAELLAALTAGDESYNNLTRLADDLLALGETYARQGDEATAQEVFEGVAEFGRQVDQHATMADEQLAGLDMQRAAYEQLTTLESILQSEQELAQLALDSEFLVEGLEQIGRLFEQLDSFWAQSGEMALWALFADTVLSNGNLNLGDLLP